MSSLRGVFIINRIDDICKYDIKGYEKVILIEDLIKNWREEGK